MSRTIATIIVTAYFAFALIVASLARGATAQALHHRAHRQTMNLHRYRGTLNFFRNHRRLARTLVGRREVRRARIWIAVIERELRETRVALRRHLTHDWLWNAFLCIHHYEGAWNDNTGNGYYGGLQFGYSEWRRFGGRYAAYAYQATPAQQIAAAEAYYRVSGFRPWPQTARACGLL